MQGSILLDWLPEISGHMRYRQTTIHNHIDVCGSLQDVLCDRMGYVNQTEVSTLALFDLLFIGVILLIFIFVCSAHFNA